MVEIFQVGKVQSCLVLSRGSEAESELGSRSEPIGCFREIVLLTFYCLPLTIEYSVEGLKILVILVVAIAFSGMLLTRSRCGSSVKNHN